MADEREAAVAEEQRHVDRAYARLDELRARAERRRREALAAPVTTHADLVDRDAAAAEAASRVTALTLGDREPLVFGRIDRDDGERFHVGRASILSQEYEALVVDWRSDVAAPFYRATPVDPQGLRRRRVIHSRGREVLTVEDQLLDLDDRGDSDPLIGDAALMAAITRERSPYMHDIVATIQREQDEIIRLPARGIVVVTGGPGTGKTAVALHRVAYLLYRHRQRLEQRGVLVVGPSRAFAEYIRTVLPSLGETTAVLTPVGSFVPGMRTDRHDPRDVSRVKGDERMIQIARRALAAAPATTPWQRTFQRLRSGELDVRRIGGGVLSGADLRLLYESWRDDVATGREVSVEDVAVADELRVQHARHDDAGRQARRRPEDRGEVTTFGDRSARRDLGELISAPEYTGFGHVVVDEAQDLSVLQWRMVARRGIDATWTVVGDLAQRSTPSAPRDWQAVARLVDRRDVITAGLSVNYRTSAPIMSFAARLLPVVAPGQTPPRSARESERQPMVRTGVTDVIAEAASAARDARADGAATVGVAAPSTLVEQLRSATTGAEGVRVFDPWTVKGLEFDAVVVVEPDAVVEEAGFGALYVALTRATERLTVITAQQQLPAPLA